MTKNQLFRQFHCNLSIEDTAELCFKTVSTVKRWDSGDSIPRECRRLMRMYSYREICSSQDWKGFYCEQGKLVLPSGERLSAAQLLIATALIEINDDQCRLTSSRILRHARTIASILATNR